MPQFKFTKIWYSPFFNVGGYYFNKQPHGGGLATMFIPVWQNQDSFVFAQGRFFPQSEGVYEANYSLGYRHLNSGHHTMWGVSASFDRMKSLSNFYYNQVSLNGVMWHNRWTVDGNVYIPVGQKRYIDAVDQVATLRQNGIYENLYYGAGYERSLAGADVEVGNNIWRGLTAYIGGYYYHHQDTPTISGPQANVNYSWYSSEHHRILGLFNRVTAEAEVQHDGHRGTGVYVGMRFRINIGSASDGLSGVAKHMLDPIRRDLHITTTGYHNPEHELETTTGPDGKKRAINIREVSSKSDLESALQDPNADVIAVNGTISGLNNEIINRSVYLTGGRFSFVRNGETFNEAVGKNGVLQAASGANLLQIGNDNLLKLGESETNDRSITIRDMGLEVTQDSGNYAVWNGMGTENLGTVNLENDTSNGRLHFTLDGSGITGTLSMTDDTFNSGNWNPDSSASADAQALSYIGTSNGASFTIDALNGDNFTSNGAGLTIQAVGLGSSINFAANADNDTYVSFDNNAFNLISENGATISGMDFDNDTFIAEKAGSSALSYTANLGAINVGYLNGDTMYDSGANGFAIYNVAENEGSIITQGLNGDTLTATGAHSSADANYSNGLDSSIVVANGFNGDTFTATDYGSANYAENGASINVGGYDDDKITINSDTFTQAGVSALVNYSDGGVITIGQIQDDTLNSNPISGESGGGIADIATNYGAITHQDIDNNTIDINGGSGSIGLYANATDGSNIAYRNINNNTFNDNGDTGYGASLIANTDSSISISNMNDNTFNGDSIAGLFIKSDGSGSSATTDTLSNNHFDGEYSLAAIDGLGYDGGSLAINGFTNPADASSEANSISSANNDASTWFGYF